MNERQRFADLLRNCAKNLLVKEGLLVHAAVVKRGYGYDSMISIDLIDMYGKCGLMDMAYAVFNRMPERNVVSWTALMCGHLRQGNAKGSLLLFSQMRSASVEPNEYTLSTNIKACGFLGVPENGKQIHGLCCKTGFEWFPVIGNSLIDMYSRCCRIKEASQMFDVMPVRNLISWNVMIAAYTLEGMGVDSLHLFKEMQKHGEVPDEFSFTSTLKACTDLGAIQEGTQIHAYLITSGFPLRAKMIISGALIDLYVKCGYLAEAREVFNHVEKKSVISWTTLILGYAQEENLFEAMDLFSQLRRSSVQVDEFVLSSVMGIFADLALIEQGKQMHCYAIKVPSGLDISVVNTIMDMYLKCGLMEEAETLFDEMPHKSVVSWTVMITGYGRYGLGKKASTLFKKMQSDGIEPDGVTYLAVLSACSHTGLIEECKEYFSRLREDRRIKPRVEHYACMVDLLGRAGHLKEAKNLIDNMPVKPNIGIWQILLSACRVHGDSDMGKEVGEIVLRLDGDNPANYVAMSNIYANAGKWKECERLREVVKAKGLKKVAARSWVEINKEVHFLFNGDETHPLTEKIHLVLKDMERRMKEELGYAYEVRFSMHDIEEESKEHCLRVHSEKLAIGLALVCEGVEEGERPIRVFKNLRVCVDCHEFIKCLSKILKKVFVIRDANRFHKFEDGSCSCQDYW